jgi:adenine/guanine phosphoribosyltransferase-like PRPP-binding protein
VTVPTPRTLYVHDDLVPVLGTRFGDEAPITKLARELLMQVAGDGKGVLVLSLESQLAALIARGEHAPFDAAIGIAGAGEVVARQLHARTGWFPVIHRVDVTRVETTAGSYVLDTQSRPALAAQAAALDLGARVAVVDDTVYSGLTMRAVLSALPVGVRARAQAFCLRGVADSIATVAALCPITAGFVASGRLDHDVSFINASGLVRRGAIRRAGTGPLAFFERPEWLRAWFPGRDAAILAICRDLHALLTDAGLGDL